MIYYVRHDPYEVRGGTSCIQTYTEGIIPSIIGINDKISVINSWNECVSIESLANDDIFFIESDITPSDKELFKFIKYSHNKIYLRYHNTLLYHEDRFCTDTYLTDSIYEYLGDWYQVSKLNDNFTLVVLTDFEDDLCRLLNINHILDTSLSKFDTPNTNKDHSSVHNTINNNILYVSGSANKIKGFLSLFYAILADTKCEFNWYIVGNILNEYTESTHDQLVLNGLYKLVFSKPNVYYIKYTKDISGYYKLCSRVLVLSPYEDVTFTMREALSYGCRVYCYDTCKPPYLGNELVNVMDSNGEYSYMNLGYILYNALESGTGLMDKTKLPSNSDIIARHFMNLCKLQGMNKEIKYE